MMKPEDMWGLVVCVVFVACMFGMCVFIQAPSACHGKRCDEGLIALPLTAQCVCVVPAK